MLTLRLLLLPPPKMLTTYTNVLVQFDHTFVSYRRWICVWSKTGPPINLSLLCPAIRVRSSIR